jgi:hypothetical protein
MTYDWEGKRTRRIRNIKIGLAMSLPILLLGLGALRNGF